VIRAVVVFVVFLLALAAACSSHPPKTNGTGTGAGAPDAGAATPPTGDGAGGAVSAADCDKVIDHVLGVMNDELRAQVPEDEWPTEEQLAESRARLATDFMDECRQYDRAVIDCILAGKDSAAIAECATVE